VRDPGRERVLPKPPEGVAAIARGDRLIAVGEEIDITVLLFASLRDAAGVNRITLRLPAATPVGAVWNHLPEPVRALGLPAGLRYALNHEWTVPGAPMRDGDQVALVLPVSGG
jgi:molybdopterin converting factor small subunit